MDITDAQIISIPSDQPTIQTGINAASNGDTVLVTEGTYLENINFKGKAITVASRFILDGDTSHISKTIIDGSNAANPDSASTVIMNSGEDTTSVLMGFTITGGKGTRYANEGFMTISGGGVSIINSGGKIMHNTIEENHLSHSSTFLGGGGLYVHVSGNHNAVISNNIIRNNTCTGYSGGGGAGLEGGRIIFENNLVENNSINSSADFVNGGGIFYVNSLYTGVIEDVHIRNNIVADNEAICTDNSKALGAGIFQSFGFEQKKVQIYNNLIFDNSTNGTGGGIYLFGTSADFYNNTLWNNNADANANSLAVRNNSRMVMYNNIVWSEIGTTLNEVNVSSKSKIYSYYNLIREEFRPGNPVTAYRNYYDLKPIFKADSYELADKSPGIGWGMDTLEIQGIWYAAPNFDFEGNARPDPIDKRVDVGAIESPYEGFVHIPDTAFFHALIDKGVDNNEDSLISFAEAEAIISLNVADKEILDLTGIEAFVNLDTLDCSSNSLTSLDVSSNPGLSKLDANMNDLTSLDVSGNGLLIWLSCWSNELTHLDLSNNPALKFLYLRDNQINSLDISNHLALEYLRCRANQLDSLDLTNNTSLKRISIDKMPMLSEVCVWELPFPPEGVEVDTTGSPNVCFDTICNGVCEGEGVGIDEQSLTGLSIYPNPASNLIIIETNKPGQQFIEITSLNGQLLYIDRMEGPMHQINLTSFQKGFYFITVRSRDYVRTEKIIKF